MASQTSTPRTRSPSTSSDSSDTTMLDAPTHVALTPTRPRQPSVTTTTSAPAQAPTSDPSFSLLLSLPRELRDRVYTFALTSPYPFSWPGQAPLKHNVSVKLLQANKQVYNEAISLLYTENKFLFTHPSDCNIFRVVASPHAEGMNNVYFRIREKDLRLWTTYLGSKSADRSLRADLPKLKNLWIFLRCGNPGTPRLLSTLGVAGAGNVPPAMAVHVQAVQNALGQQVAALQHQVQHLTHAVGATGPPVIVPAGGQAGQHIPALQPQNAAADATAPQHHVPPPPPPPPPPPAMPFATFAAGAVPHHHPQPPAPTPQTGQGNHQILATFLRFERELGIESLCLSLRETLQDPLSPTHHAPSHPSSLGGHRERRRHLAPQEPSHDHDHDHDRHRHLREPHPAPAPAVVNKETPDVKIVCIMRVPKPEVSRLVRMYPEELSVDRNGDARTRFRRLHGAEICVEISGVEGMVG